MNRLEIVGLTDDVERARSVAKAVGGRVLCDQREISSSGASLPYRALFSAVTDAPEDLVEASEVGAYFVLRRVIRARPVASGTDQPQPGAIALFTMVRRGDLTHREADRHWRDVHVALALRHHVAMSHYTQLSVVHRIHGPEWDGFALCGFDSIEDLRGRFYETEEGRRAIREDVARFADPSRSPRRLIVTEQSWETPCG